RDDDDKGREIHQGPDHPGEPRGHQRQGPEEQGRKGRIREGQRHTLEVQRIEAGAREVPGPHQIDQEVHLAPVKRPTHRPRERRRDGESQVRLVSRGQGTRCAGGRNAGVVAAQTERGAHYGVQAMDVDATVSTHMAKADKVTMTTNRWRETPAATMAKRGKPRNNNLGEIPTIGERNPKSSTAPAYVLHSSGGRSRRQTAMMPMAASMAAVLASELRSCRP